MQLLNNSTSFSQSINTITENSKTTKPKLSMIWVKEFDGKRDRLIALWVKQD